ncbi:hypothetical protein OB04_02578 [Bacillus subtilis]|nr:hypothetical protein OB04_02578 [Bacillus subtilis]
MATYVRVSTRNKRSRDRASTAIEACIKKAGTKDVLKYADKGFSGELISDEKNDFHNSFK